MKRHIHKTICQKLWPDQNLDHFPDEITVCIDSRLTTQHDIFFAIRGELKDGHDFVVEAHQKGASLIVCEEAYRNRFKNQLPIIFVEDSLREFSKLAYLHLKSLSPTKIAITGSNGKTTTKEMIKAALARVLGEESVYASLGNKNNHFGVPLSALEVTAQHKVAIFEMGMNHAGEISALCQIVEPDIGVITNIGHAHEGNFDDGIAGVQHAKGELFLSLSKRNGCAVVNLDDERVVAMADTWQIEKRVTFGCNKNADIAITQHETLDSREAGQTILAATPQGVLSFAIPLLGEHNAHNAACALAVVQALNLSLNDAALGLADMKKTQGRLFIHHTDKGYAVIDDGYNANPTSMAAGIKASLSIPGTRRIAAIGAMGELGAYSQSHHVALGKLLAQNFDYLYFCGPDTHYAIEGAKHAGFKESKILYKDSSVELIEPLKMMLKEGDLLFVKGSLSANMQAITRALIAS
jgi:UDP-N-acetylmuramoyl-tripeptide--D-alanyl-D-alanine ligase